MEPRCSCIRTRGVCFMRPYICIYIWMCLINPFKFLIKLICSSQIYVSHTFGLRLVTFRQSFHNMFEKSIRSYTFRATPSQFQEHIRLYYVLSTFLYVSITFGSRFAHYSSHSYVSYTFYARAYTFHRGFRTCNRNPK